MNFFSTVCVSLAILSAACGRQAVQPAASASEERPAAMETESYATVYSDGLPYYSSEDLAEQGQGGVEFIVNLDPCERDSRARCVVEARHQTEAVATVE